MIIVRFMGGLGNQMFQYAFGLAMEQRGVDVKYDISWMKYHSKKLEVQDIFCLDLSEKIASIEECNKLGYTRYDTYGRLRQIFNIKKSFIYQRKPIDSIRFNERLMHKDNTYYAGYFQCENYFLSIKEQVKHVFKFNDSYVREKTNKYNRELIKKIVTSESVAIHIRRGDYLNNNIYDALDNDYYDKAISRMYSIYSKPTFIIFSNDIPYCKNKYDNINAEFVDWNMGESSWVDMYLMTLCKGVVIPNSTFSWWGAWLNKNDGKTVIAPYQWFRDIPAEDIAPDSWIRL